MPPSPFKVTHLEVSGETPHGGSNLRLGGPAVRSSALATAAPDAFPKKTLGAWKSWPIEEGLSGRSEPCAPRMQRKTSAEEEEEEEETSSAASHA